MELNDQIEQLKFLKMIADRDDAFKKHESLLVWIDKTAPLLKYDDEHYSLFMDAALKVSLSGVPHQIAVACLNVMKGTVNRAITELENGITTPQKQKGLEYPQEVTLKWIREHVPIKYYWTFILILAFVFGLGIAFSQTRLYKAITDTATAIVKTNENVEKTRK